MIYGPILQIFTTKWYLQGIHEVDAIYGLFSLFSTVGNVNFVETANSVTFEQKDFGQYFDLKTNIYV